MEFIDRLFGITRKRQEREQSRLISELGIQGERRKELVGPEYEDVTVVKIDNDQFLQLLQSKKPVEVLSNVVHVSDSHVASIVCSKDQLLLEDAKIYGTRNIPSFMEEENHF